MFGVSPRLTEVVQHLNVGRVEHLGRRKPLGLGGGGGIRLGGSQIRLAAGVVCSKGEAGAGVIPGSDSRDGADLLLFNSFWGFGIRLNPALRA